MNAGKIKIKGPKGEWLYLTLVHVIDRDEKGRVRNFRAYYDDDQMNLGEIKAASPTPEKDLEFYMVWMTGSQLHGGKKPNEKEPGK